MKVNDLNDSRGFLESFLEEYLLRGLGSLQKRDVEILFVHLLLKDKTFGQGLELYKMSHALGISESKVRRLVLDSQLRYQSYTEEMAKEDFLDLMFEGTFFVDRFKRINFIIRKPMLRQFFEEWISRFSGLVDTSFNKNLVKVSLDDLSEVILGLTHDESGLEIIKKNLDEPKKGLTPKKYVALFLKKFFTDPECSIEYGSLILKQIILN